MASRGRSGAGSPGIEGCPGCRGRRHGTLTILASGPHDRCRPVFDAVGTTIDVGAEPGAGQRMKLVLNHWVIALVEARFGEGTHETYQVPLGLRPAAEGFDRLPAHSVLCRS